jgi:hypothetical protein
MWFSNGSIHKLKGFKKGGIIAESKHINQIEAMCPKFDLMRALLRNKTTLFPVVTLKRKYKDMSNCRGWYSNIGYLLLNRISFSEKFDFAVSLYVV